MTGANKYTPRTEYMKIISKMRLPIFTRPVRDNKNVMKVLLNALFLLNR